MTDIERIVAGLSEAEIERRRQASIVALRERQKTEWEARYQERCDRFYWQRGRCCAGCDHWASDAGDFGQCMSAPPVSGQDVLKSLGIDWASYIPPPDHPYTQREHVCGAFKDDFDWSLLPDEYLQRIGARL